MTEENQNLPAKPNKNKMDISNRLYKITSILVGGILVFLLITLYINNKSVPGNYPREITVSATGQTAVIPDIATIRLGVTTEGDEVSEVTSENTEKINTIIGEIKALGVNKEDVQTTRYSLSPRYDWDEGRRNFAGYELIQEITIKIRDFSKVGEVLDRATSSGANIVEDLQFVVEDIDAAKEDAIVEAIGKAKEKAKILARASGLKLGKIVNIYENYYYPQEDQYKYAMEGVGMGGRETLDIEPGEQEISVEVNIVYRLR